MTLMSRPEKSDPIDVWYTVCPVSSAIAIAAGCGAGFIAPDPLAAARKIVDAEKAQHAA